MGLGFVEGLVGGTGVLGCNVNSEGVGRVCKVFRLKMSTDFDGSSSMMYVYIRRSSSISFFVFAAIVVIVPHRSVCWACPT